MQHTPELRENARQLFLQGVSFRDIASRLLPEASGGYVTVFRWSKKYHWDADKEEQERRQKEAVHDKFVGKMLETAHRHYKIADLAEEVVLLALKEYIVFDPDTNQPVSLKKNANGNPIIRGEAVVSLLREATALKRAALGVTDAMPLPEMESGVQRQVVVEEDVSLLRQFGNYLALQSQQSPLPDAQDTDTAPEMTQTSAE